MAGIERIEITNQIRGMGANRFAFSEARWNLANEFYRSIFKKMNCPLADGEGAIKCDRDDIEAAYDILLGVDIIFKFENGMSATCQEKILNTMFDTVTIEYYNDHPSNTKPGDWFNLHANYYFVAYDARSCFQFNSWVFLDWIAIQRATLQNRITWKQRHNMQDGAQASFMYERIDNLPLDCVIAKGIGGETFFNSYFLQPTPEPSNEPKMIQANLLDLI